MGQKPLKYGKNKLLLSLKTIKLLGSSLQIFYCVGQFCVAADEKFPILDGGNMNGYKWIKIHLLKEKK